MTDKHESRGKRTLGRRAGLIAFLTTALVTGPALPSLAGVSGPGSLWHKAGPYSDASTIGWIGVVVVLAVTLSVASAVRRHVTRKRTTASAAAKGGGDSERPTAGSRSV